MQRMVWSPELHRYLAPPPIPSPQQPVIDQIIMSAWFFVSLLFFILCQVINRTYFFGLTSVWYPKWKTVHLFLKIARIFSSLFFLCPYSRRVVTKEYSMITVGLFSPIFHKNICCGYSLEAPRRGASNEYHNLYFYGEIRKIIPQLSLNTSPEQCWYSQPLEN